MSDSPLKPVAERIKRARKDLKLSQAGVAEAIGQAQATVSQWETGRNAPKYHIIGKLAEALKVTPSWILFGEEEQDSPSSPTSKGQAERLARDKIITPDQCRAARALLHINQGKLAREAEVATKTIADFERGLGRAMHILTLRSLRAALESLGVELIEANGSGPGVRLKKKTKG